MYSGIHPSGAVIVTPADVLERWQLARSAWEWVGEDETRRRLVRAGKA